MWANGLNPNDPTAFITALMFESSGSFTGTMTAITTNVPEPSSLPLFASAFLGWGAWLRRRTIRGQDTELRQRVGQSRGTSYLRHPLPHRAVLAPACESLG